MTNLNLAVYDTKKASQALDEEIKRSIKELEAKRKALTSLESQVATQIGVVNRLAAQLAGYEEARDKLVAEGM